MVTMKTFKTRNEWLSARKIGASDAACIVGMNPWKSNVDFWMEKTGQVEHEDISDKPYVEYGVKAEAPLRQIFKLDYPDLAVYYRKNNLWTNDKYPWAHVSLDGWLTDRDGRKGILEIKTTNIMASRQKEEWNNRIPDNYFCQLLHGFAVTEFEFAVLKAQLRWVIECEVYCQVKHYRIERSDVEDDIRYLMDAERRFVEENLEKRIRPGLILPEL